MLQAHVVGTGAAAPAGAPSGVPSNVLHSLANGGPAPDNIDLIWTNGDITAETEIAFATVFGGDPGPVVATVAPGVTQWSTGLHGWIVTAVKDVRHYSVRHKKAGGTTAWAAAGSGVTETFPEGGL